MKGKILAATIYNIIFWGIFVLFSYVIIPVVDEGWILYLIMPCAAFLSVIYYVVYYRIFDAETIRIKEHAFQLFIQVIVTIVFNIIVQVISFCVHYDPHPSAFQMDGILELMIGIYGTVSFIVITVIGAAFIMEDGKTRILAAIIYHTVKWGIYIVSSLFLDWRTEITICYAVLMPVLFYVVCNRIAPPEETSMGQYVFQLFVQIMIESIFIYIVIGSISGIIDVYSGVAYQYDRYRLWSFSTGAFRIVTIFNALFVIIRNRTRRS